MLWLKLNHVSKRGHWEPILYAYLKWAIIYLDNGFITSLVWIYEIYLPIFWVRIFRSFVSLYQCQLKYPEGYGWKQIFHYLRKALTMCIDSEILCIALYVSNFVICNCMVDICCRTYALQYWWYRDRNVWITQHISRISNYIKLIVVSWRRMTT